MLFLSGYSLEELFELAAQLKHMDGHVLFRPDPPRPQREISTIEEDPEASEVQIHSSFYVLCWYRSR